MKEYDLDSVLSEIVPSKDILPLDKLKYSKTYPSNKLRGSLEWQESLRFWLKHYLETNEPIIVWSMSEKTRAMGGNPKDDVVWITNLNPARISVQKLLSKNGVRGVSYPYSEIYGIQACRPEKKERDKAIVAMRKAFNIAPSGEPTSTPTTLQTLHLETPSKQKGLSYELYIGLMAEQRGYHVTYNGLKSGLYDNGIDLIIEDKSTDTIFFVQAKNRKTELNREEIVSMKCNFEAFTKIKGGNKNVVWCYFHTNEIDTTVKETLSLEEIVSYQVEMPSIFFAWKCIQDHLGNRFILPFEHDRFLDENLADHLIGLWATDEEKTVLFQKD